MLETMVCAPGQDTKLYLTPSVLKRMFQTRVVQMESHKQLVGHRSNFVSGGRH